MKYLFLICVSMFLVGCANFQKVAIDEKAHQELFNKKVAHKKMPTPDFTAMTTGKAAFGLLGAVAMISAGNEIVEKNDIKDPAIEIKKALLDKIQNKYSIIVSESDFVVLEEKDIKALSKHFSSHDYVLDTESVYWDFLYFPTDWAHYKVRYGVKSRLIDTKAERVVSESFCEKESSSENPPSYQQLIGNNAEMLKQTLTQFATACADSLYADMFPREEALVSGAK